MLSSDLPLLRLAVFVGLSLAAGPLPAQLFNGGGGLFNRKTDPPRAQTEDEIGVPVPVTGRVEALKGHEVTFEIRAESKTPGATVEFLIRVFPSAGKIVSMVSKPNERNKAIVTYWADPSSSATADAFSFAVRYRGGRYSPEMRYDIGLVDVKSEVQAPSELDFGSVTIGQEEVRELVVRNLGGAAMDRQIFLMPPWHLVEPADGKLTLGPNGSRVLKVAFRPELMGETSYFLSFSRSKSGTTKLVGSGADPFQIVTEAVELKLDKASGERRGEIELRNSGSKAIVLETRSSTRLQSHLRQEYVVAPEKTTKVQVKLGATDTAPFDGSVEFFLKNGYAKPVRVFAPVVPGRLEVKVPGSITAEVINFGAVEAGRSVERGIVVTNRGGVAVPLEFHVPEPFRLLTNPGPQLAPLTSVDLSIGLQPATTSRGAVDVTMNVRGVDHSLPIRLMGNVVAPSGAPPAATVGGASVTNLPMKGVRIGAGKGGSSPDPEPGAVPADAPVAVARPASPPQGTTGNEWKESLTPAQLVENRSPLGFVSRPIVERNTDLTLRRPEDLTVLETGSDSLVIAWTAPKDTGPAFFEVEMRGVLSDPETGKLESVWVPYPAVTFDRIDRLVKAKLANLNPVSQYEFRVVLTTQDGRSSPPSEALVASTDLPMDWTYIYAGLGVLLLLGIGFGIWRIYLDRRPEVYQSQYVDL